MFLPSIGLEIHTELKTKNKMFCSCLNDPEEERPNVNICPICLAHPGVLPTINKEAVEKVIKVGLALNSKISKFSKFDRKNYFYPDLPKGYQISQYDAPLCVGGSLNNVSIRRIHLEEDTGRLIHGKDFSLVDFNRAGVPLMELVTEPDIKSAAEALSFVKELQLILRYLNVSDADMEKGQLRIEVNISVQPEISNFKSQTPNKLGTKVEIKNLNSFRAVGEAIGYEIQRQKNLLEKGEKIIQETRGWDDKKKITVSQRLKEESHDYRYFPEPDLPPLDLEKFDLDNLRRELPELPTQKRERFIKEYGLLPKQVEILVVDRFAAEFFEEAASELKIQNPKSKFQTLYNYLTSDLFGLVSQAKIGYKDLKITPENFAELINIIDKGEISTRTAKDILKIMFETGRDPSEIIETEGLKQISDESGIIEIVKKVILENQKAVEDYKKGRENALQFLIGRAMSELKGRANPKILEELFKKELKD